MTSNFFKGKEVLVAGGTGMIGRPLVEMLLERSARVRVASKDNPDRANPNAEFIQCDLTRPDDCKRICEGIDMVFNLLCTKGSPSTCQTNPLDYFEPMLLYNTLLMQAAYHAGVKSFLFTSSVCVYPPSETFYENDPLDRPPSPNDPGAGWAKRMGELQAKFYFKQYGWRVAIVRPANVYGPYDNFNRFNSMVVPSLIRRAAEAEDKIVLDSDGTTIRDFIYCDDVARGMLLTVEKQLDQNYPINLGSGAGVTIRELVETIVRISGKKLKIVFDSSKPSGDKKRVFDIAQARAIGFTPQVSLEEGIARTYHWYVDNRETADSRYDVFNRPPSSK